MTADDLDALFRAWREDIDSEPFQTFVELLVPKGQQK